MVLKLYGTLRFGQFQQLSSCLYVIFLRALLSMQVSLTWAEERLSALFANVGARIRVRARVAPRRQK
jgi:hypothetical protein